MTHHERSSREVDQCFLKHSQSRQVEIVGRLVEHEKVPAPLQDLGEEHPVLFSSRQITDPVVNPVITEKKSPQVAAH